MGFFIAMFCCNLFIPLVMVVAGYLMYKHPPKEINSIIGYRTTMSGKNKDTWKFAHDYCGKLWLKIGIVLLILSAIAQIPFIHSSDDAIGTCVLLIESIQVILLIASIVPVEKALKRTFDKNGNRR